MQPTRSKRRGHVETDKVIIRRINEARILQGVSVATLADQLDLSVQQMQKYEKCLNSLSVGRLIEISQKLKVNVGYFLQDFSHSYENPVPSDIMLPYLNIKSPRQKEAVKNLVIALSQKETRRKYAKA